MYNSYMELLLLHGNSYVETVTVEKSKRMEGLERKSTKNFAEAYAFKLSIGVKKEESRYGISLHEVGNEREHSKWHSLEVAFSYRGASSS